MFALKVVSKRIFHETLTGEKFLEDVMGCVCVFSLYCNAAMKATISGKAK